MKDKPTPFFVLFGKKKTHRGISEEVCFGGNWRREKCELVALSSSLAVRRHGRHTANSLTSRMVA